MTIGLNRRLARLEASDPPPLRQRYVFLRHHSLVDLQAATNRYLAEHNQGPEALYLDTKSDAIIGEPSEGTERWIHPLVRCLKRHAPNAAGAQRATVQPRDGQEPATLPRAQNQSAAYPGFPPQRAAEGS
jgi:hypothetical protein